jgi:hypothetical protein
MVGLNSTFTVTTVMAQQLPAKEPGDRVWAHGGLCFLHREVWRINTRGDCCPLRRGECFEIHSDTAFGGTPVDPAYQVSGKGPAIVQAYFSTSHASSRVGQSIQHSSQLFWSQRATVFLSPMKLLGLPSLQISHSASCRQ